MADVQRMWTAVDLVDKMTTEPSAVPPVYKECLRRDGDAPATVVLGIQREHARWFNDKMVDISIASPGGDAYKTFQSSPCFRKCQPTSLRLPLRVAIRVPGRVRRTIAGLTLGTGVPEGSHLPSRAMSSPDNPLRGRRHLLGGSQADASVIDVTLSFDCLIPAVELAVRVRHTTAILRTNVGM